MKGNYQEQKKIVCNTSYFFYILMIIITLLHHYPHISLQDVMNKTETLKTDLTSIIYFKEYMYMFYNYCSL